MRFEQAREIDPCAELKESDDRHDGDHRHERPQHPAELRHVLQALGDEERHTGPREDREHDTIGGQELVDWT